MLMNAMQAVLLDSLDDLGYEKPGGLEANIVNAQLTNHNNTRNINLIKHPFYLCIAYSM